MNSSLKNTYSNLIINVYDIFYTQTHSSYKINKPTHKQLPIAYTRITYFWDWYRNTLSWWPLDRLMNDIIFSTILSLLAVYCPSAPQRVRTDNRLNEGWMCMTFTNEQASYQDKVFITQSTIIIYPYLFRTRIISTIKVSSAISWPIFPVLI